MFSPNTDSFVLIRRSIVKPGFPAFLPYTDSFLLIRKSTVKPEFTPTPVLEETGVGAIPQSTDSKQTEVNDEKKRNFLKVAGVAGAGIVASQILSPKKASAFIMGSSPTTGVVGVKNAANERINPATEETVSSLLKASDLDFDIDTGSLKVKITSTSGEGSSSFSDSGGAAKSALVDAERHVQVDVLEGPPTASTEDTLEKISFGGVKFALRLATDSGDSNIDYVGEAAIGSAINADAWRIKRIDSSDGIVIQWAGDDAGSAGTFDQVWNNRATLDYF